MRLNVHFHTLWSDGVFTCSSAGGDRATFHPASEITDHDIFLEEGGVVTRPAVAAEPADPSPTPASRRLRGVD